MGLDNILVPNRRQAIISTNNDLVYWPINASPGLNELSVYSVLCGTYHVIDDERHFVTKCRIKACERKSFFQKMSFVDPNFTALDDKNKFVNLMESQDQRTLRWLSKFLHSSFDIRNETIYSSSWCILYIWYLIVYIPLYKCFFLG